MALRDVIGQDRAVNILIKTIQRGRIPSSYLFAGESGIGKKFTSFNLAKALNCLSREQRAESRRQKGITNSGLRTHDLRLTTFDCCDECASCKKIDKGIHPDILFISPEGGQIRVEEIRSIDNVLSLKAFEGRYKVVIVDDADTMNQFAANAFLKTLEEPPENSLIILVSSNPERLPDTIRSRCSRINFTPLPNEACKKVLEKVISQQSIPPPAPPLGTSRFRPRGGRVREGVKAPKHRTSIPTDSHTLSLLVRLSMGRPGNVIAGDLIEEREWFLKLLKDMLNAEKDGWTSKEEMEKWFELLLTLLRDMAITKITHDEANLINVDLKEYLKKFSTSMDLMGIIKNYQILNTIKGYFNFHLNKSLTWNYTGSLLRKTIGDIYA